MPPDPPPDLPRAAAPDWTQDPTEAIRRLRAAGRILETVIRQSLESGRERQAILLQLGVAMDSAIAAVRGLAARRAPP